MPAFALSLFAKPLQGVLIVALVMGAVYFIGREIGISKIETEYA
jgi:hypothetical protein